MTIALAARRLRTIVLCCLAGFCMTCPALAQNANDKVHVDIPAQSLSSALTQFGRDTGTEIVFTPDAVNQKVSTAIKGDFAKDEAIALMLAGTGLSYRVTSQGAIVVLASTELNTSGTGSSDRAARVAQADDANYQSNSENPQNTTVPKAAPANSDDSAKPKLSEVVVTGTHISGIYPEASPLQSYSLVEIKSTGANTIPQFFEQLPANFNSLSTYALSAAPTVQGQYFSSGVDLRGLGVGTTLVLVNGRELAPSSSGTTPDISLLPIDLVKRVDILTDGASAIYGSDAVGGVVNFTLRDDFNGAETAAGYGEATSCCTDQWHVQQTFGQTWNTGNVVISSGYSGQSALSALDRSFSQSAGNLNLLPPESKWNIFASGKQEFSTNVAAFASALYSYKHDKFDSLETLTGVTQQYNTPTTADDLFVNAGLDFKLPRSLSLELVSTYSRATEDQSGTVTPNPGDSPFTNSDASSDLDLTAKLDGPIVELPAGTTRFAAGGGYTRDKYSSTTINPLTPTEANLSRNIEYGYGELFVPLVGKTQQIPGVDGLDLSLAGRFTHYSDFGDNFSPKIGVAWRVDNDLTLRGTFAQSFRAPFLSQLDSANTAWGIFPVSLFPAIASKYGLPASDYLLYASGNNPAVGPEKAKTFTGGFDFKPRWVSGFKMSLTYFNTKFSGQIAEPDPNSSDFSNPSAFPSLITLNPSVGYISRIISGATNFLNLAPGSPTSASAVAGATAIAYDDRDTNISATQVSGLDFAADYTRGIWAAGLQGTRLFQYSMQATAGGPTQSYLNTVTHPVATRVKAWTAVNSGPWTGSVTANFTGAYSNPFDPVSPNVGSWTTLDLFGSYKWASTSGLTKGLRISVSVRNLLNTNPPFVGTSKLLDQGVLEPVGFDPSNANPIGRFISFEIVKGW